MYDRNFCELFMIDGSSGYYLQKYLKMFMFSQWFKLEHASIKSIWDGECLYVIMH